MECAVNSGICHEQWNVPSTAECAMNSGICHEQWNVPCTLKCAMNSGTIAMHIRIGFCFRFCEWCFSLKLICDFIKKEVGFSLQIEGIQFD